MVEGESQCEEGGGHDELEKQSGLDEAVAGG